MTIGSLDEPGAVAPRSQLGVESRVPLARARARSLPAMTTEDWLAQKKIVATSAAASIPITKPERSAASSAARETEP